jgi:hypothetical protein
MKKQMFTVVAILFFASLSTSLFAQEQHHSQKSPKWLSSNGYWVVESNVKTPKNSTIYFYNTDDVMVYKETVQGVKIRVDRVKTLKRLRTVLDESVIAWQQQHVIKENQMLVATAFRR